MVSISIGFFALLFAMLHGASGSRLNIAAKVQSANSEKTGETNSLAVNEEDAGVVAEVKSANADEIGKTKTSSLTEEGASNLFASVEETTQIKTFQVTYQEDGMGFKVADKGPLIVIQVSEKHTLPWYGFQDKLLVGDLILAVNDNKVTDQNQFLHAIMKATGTPKKFTITTQRAGAGVTSQLASAGMTSQRAGAKFRKCDMVKVVNEGPHFMTMGWVGMVMEVDTSETQTYDGGKPVNQPVYNIEFGRDGEFAWSLDHTYLQEWLEGTTEPFNLGETKAEFTRKACAKGGLA